MCWFERRRDEVDGAPAVADGLGLLPGSDSVHYRAEPERRPHFLDAVGDGELPPGYGGGRRRRAPVAGTELVEAVSARPDGGAWRVAVEDGAAVEHPLAVERLAEPERADPTPLSIAEFRGAAARLGLVNRRRTRPIRSAGRPQTSRSLTVFPTRPTPEESLR